MLLCRELVRPAREGGFMAMSLRMTKSLHTTPERSRLMASVRQKDTWPELIVQSVLRASGYHFSRKSRGLPGSPDIVNRAEKWAVFVHGCFWHAHNNCSLWKIPRNNQPFWEAKFRGNRERDKRKVRELKGLGYRVLVIWQCQLKDETKLRRRIQRFVKPNSVS